MTERFNVQEHDAENKVTTKYAVPRTGAFFPGFSRNLSEPLASGSRLCYTEKDFTE
jgi:hypothetical protein